MKAFVTGGAGFVGSHIVDRLLKENYEVIVYDNFCTGNEKFLENAKKDKNLKIIEGDLLDTKKLTKSLQNVDIVFHMAANADIKDNLKEPLRCLEQNTIATSNLLEAMRANNVKKIVFASTGSVYGEPKVFPTPEDAPFPIQTSMYSASKLACEGLLEAYAEGYNFQVYIFRFVSLMGERYSHGCVYDFYNKLRKDPTRLDILGNGKQKKSYLYVGDCVNAIFKVVSESKEKINIYNLGNEGYIDVTTIAEIVIKELGLKNVKIVYGDGERGWVGDSPFIHLDIKKIKSTGWKPSKDIPQCVKVTINWLKNNQWIMERK